MRSTRAPLWLVGLALVLASLACRKAETSTTATPEGDDAGDSVDADAPVDPASFGTPARWEIDGTTVAEATALPPALDRALRERGHAAAEVQDRIVFDLNDDGRLDAVLLMPAPAVAGSYDHLVLLSSGESVRVHELGELVDGALFAVAVLPLVDGPTLVGVAPRIGSCERGPQWSFLRPTGDMLENVGRIAVEPYDCAEAEAEIAFVRDADGRVTAVEVRHGQTVTRHVWDGSLGSFTAAAP